MRPSATIAAVYRLLLEDQSISTAEIAAKLDKLRLPVPTAFCISTFKAQFLGAVSFLQGEGLLRDEPVMLPMAKDAASSMTIVEEAGVTDSAPSLETICDTARRCVVCGGRFHPKRDDARTCSPRCRQRRKRMRKA